MRKLVLPTLIVFGLLLAGCYQTRVTTDRQPSDQVIEEKWATGFVNGLVTPGAKIDAAQRCDNGVAIVETEVGFLNQVVSGLTGGIYSPMTVRVTCARGGSMSGLMEAPENLDFQFPEDATEAQVRETISAAAKQSARIQKPVEVAVTGATGTK